MESGIAKNYNKINQDMESKHTHEVSTKTVVNMSKSHVNEIIGKCAYCQLIVFVTIKNK